ncbi:hypothetical protein LBMAG56_30890 [Verrucomicrobiota bacterium]|nr:hypothetical protein LBMAG56_30890 [Verrucomicrobiota bacterium]
MLDAEALSGCAASPQGSEALVGAISFVPGWRQLVAIPLVATSRRHPESKALAFRFGSTPLQKH